MTNRNAVTAILVAVLVSVLLGTALVAAQPDQNSNSSAASNTSQNSNSGSMSGQNMNGSTVDSSDRKFMMEAGMGGMAEVEWARVALQRASSDSVKQFAQQMIDDHTKANEALKQLASTKGVALPTALDNKHANMLTKLQGLSGAEFDRAYIKDAGVKAHEQMEKLFMREADRGKDADAKTFASTTLPTVQSHLSMARNLMGSMSGKSMSGGNSNMSGNMNASGNSNMSNSNMSNSNMSNSNMSNSNMSGNSNMSNSNMSGNSNMSNSNDNTNMSGNSNMSGNDNMSGNSNMSNSNTMNSNGNSNTTNANGNSNTPR